jgi:hypothetical protein
MALLQYSHSIQICLLRSWTQTLRGKGSRASVQCGRFGTLRIGFILWILFSWHLMCVQNGVHAINSKLAHRVSGYEQKLQEVMSCSVFNRGSRSDEGNFVHQTAQLWAIFRLQMTLYYDIQFTGIPRSILLWKTTQLFSLNLDPLRSSIRRIRIFLFKLWCQASLKISEDSRIRAERDLLDRTFSHHSHDLSDDLVSAAMTHGQFFWSAILLLFCVLLLQYQW